MTIDWGAYAQKALEVSKSVVGYLAKVKADPTPDLAEKAVKAIVPTVIINESDHIGRALENLEAVFTNARLMWNDDSIQQKLVHGLSIAEALEKIGAEFDPRIAWAEVPTEIIQQLIPLIVPLVHLNKDGGGGLYSDEWAKTHGLNPDGSFKEKNIFGF